jgi:DNA-binding LacI/PurR family transcriptional regulator
MATIIDVAAKAGVSTTTVSRVLNNYSPVNTQTKNRVVEAMDKLGYRPSSLARGMRTQRTRTVGILIPTYRNYWYAELLNFVELEARASGYLPIVCTTEQKPGGSEHINTLLRRQVDGIILCWYHGVMTDQGYLRSVLRDTPIVIMDQPAGGLPASSVYSNGHDGIKQLVTHLIDGGHRRIGMIKYAAENSTSENRFQGYRDALAEHGIEQDARLIVQSDYSSEGGREATARLLQKSSPTAIVTVGDDMAIGALRYCYEHQIRVPVDISITGFDDIPFARMIMPSLTTVAQPIKLMAETATRQLIRHIEHPAARKQEFVFETSIIYRESTRSLDENGKGRSRKGRKA